MMHGMIRLIHEIRVTPTQSIQIRQGNIPDEEINVIVNAANGQVAVTGAGNLACKKVIHAVGPVWKGGNQGEPTLLEAAVLNSLIKAEELGMCSVAMPAISSGIFGFPKDLCAEISLRTAVLFFRQSPTSSLVLIRFTNIDVTTVFIFHKAALAQGKVGVFKHD